MSAVAVSVLVVSNPDDQDRLLAPLRQLEFVDIEIFTGDGGDDTLDVFARVRPTVVIVGPDLDNGDARSFISAMRDLDLLSGNGPERGPRIVMIGETEGPLRTPLDVAELRIDHFLSSPASPKALAFVVRQAVQDAAEAVNTGRMPTKSKSMVGIQIPATLHAETQTSTEDSTEFELVGSALTEGQAGQAEAWDDDDDEVPLWRESTEILGDEDAASAAVDAAVDAAQPLPMFGGYEAAAPAADDDDNDERGEGADDASRADRTDAGMGAAGAGAAGDDGRGDEGAVGAAEDRDAAGDADADEVPAGMPDDMPDDGPAEALGRRPRAPAIHALPADAWADESSVVRSRTGLDLTPLPQPMPYLEDSEDSFDEFDLQLDDGEGAAAETNVDAASEDDDEGDGGAAPTRSGRFASELERKMSAMEQRLFAGRSDAVAALASAAGAPPVVVDRSRSAPMVALPPEDSAGESAEDASAAAVQTPMQVIKPAAAPEPAPMLIADCERGAIHRGRSDLAVFLDRLYRERFDGVLDLRHRRVAKSIRFEKGRPVFASSNLPEDRLGAMLSREGMLVGVQLEAVHQSALRNQRRMGEELVAMGQLKPSELVGAVQRQLEDIVFSLFAWDRGDYKLSPELRGRPEPLVIERHPVLLVMEGVRRKYDRAVLESLLGPPETVFARADEACWQMVAYAAGLSRDERSLLESFDGVRSIAEVARGGSAELLLAYQLGYGALVLGALRRRRTGLSEVAAKAAEQVADEPELVRSIDRQRVQHKHVLVDEADYFTLLGVRRGASDFEIRRAYESARASYAPTSLAPEVAEELAEELDDIREVLDEAFRVLRDAERRRAYLEHLLE
ncbi:DUF4388 domain-containing protein [Haliangium ochraceum]|uniref:Response regulator receiver protein n=1 Tax=Haliangium ochraceum (strain DSM 14365 / JCM 11303 / SMP-2) TaxID=502025 RepID=D0LZQ2_HALO1|nr:DUF4388 domain-containing protein [Haliangium ochraceum]ACY18031.1 response regulator receiver protein [Haliangium ochraceum DSM 14365]